MGAKKSPIRLNPQEKFSGAALKTLYTRRVRDGEIWCIQRYAWEIDLAPSGGNSRVRILIDGHGYKHYIAEELSVTANYLYWDDQPVWLVPGERLAVEIDQAQDATTAKLYAQGYSAPFSEGVI